jgi:hypothetical protein
MNRCVTIIIVVVSIICSVIFSIALGWVGIQLDGLYRQSIPPLEYRYHSFGLIGLIDGFLSGIMLGETIYQYLKKK